MSQFQYFSYKGFGEWVREAAGSSQTVRHGDYIEISGQGGWEPSDANHAIKSDINEEVDQVFRNVELALKEGGGEGWSQVYKIRAYLAPYSDEIAGALLRNLKQYCPDHAPILTAVGVEKLAFEGMHLEIEATAYVGQ